MPIVEKENLHSKNSIAKISDHHTKLPPSHESSVGCSMRLGDYSRVYGYRPIFGWPSDWLLKISIAIHSCGTIVE